MTRSLETPWRVIVLKNDPDHEAEKRKEIEYDFSSAGAGGRVFKANPATRGAYADD